jgi:hypothetical protein
MSVKYTVIHQGQIIGTRKSAQHLAPIYTHAVVTLYPDGTGDVLSYCSRLDLAHKEARRRPSGVVVLPVEAKVTTRKQPSQVEG